MRTIIIMLKINRNVNFDPTDMGSIFDTSMYGDYDFTRDLNNNIEDYDFNTEQARKAYINKQVSSLLWELNWYRDNGSWKYNQSYINEIIDELKYYGVEIIKRKDLKKYINRIQ